MLSFYIDDGNLITDPLPLGSRLVNDKIVIVKRKLTKTVTSQMTSGLLEY